MSVFTLSISWGNQFWINESASTSANYFIMMQSGNTLTLKLYMCFIIKIINCVAYVRFQNNQLTGVKTFNSQHIIILTFMHSRLLLLRHVQLHLGDSGIKMISEISVEITIRRGNRFDLDKCYLP